MFARRQEVGEKHMTEVQGDRDIGSQLGQLHRCVLISSTKLFKVVMVNGQSKQPSKKAYLHYTCVCVCNAVSLA